LHVTDAKTALPRRFPLIRSPPIERESLLLVKHWSNTGQTLVKHWSNTGQTLVKTLVNASLPAHPEVGPE
jgi:hypothetical protein